MKISSAVSARQHKKVRLRPERRRCQKQYSSGRLILSEKRTSQRRSHPPSPRLRKSPKCTKPNKNALQKQIGNSNTGSKTQEANEIRKGNSRHRIRPTIDTASQGRPRIKAANSGPHPRQAETPQTSPHKKKNARNQALALQEPRENCRCKILAIIKETS